MLCFQCEDSLPLCIHRVIKRELTTQVIIEVASDVFSTPRDGTAVHQDTSRSPHVYTAVWCPQSGVEL